MAESLRLLFLTQCPPSLELGGSKSQLELAAELERRGWHCQVAGPDASGIAAPAALLAEPWHVVDWDVHLALERSRLPPTTLSLARIPLLNLHLRGGHLLHGEQDRRQRVLDLVGQPPGDLLPGGDGLEVDDPTL